ncbi:MAG TPA: YceI family protein [Candidatus Elarobacter sp.]|jgi:polyisoprenoid-binding protein YceI
MLRSRTIRICTLAAAIAGWAVPARAGVAWSVDPAGSSVTLSAKELIVSKVGGTIPIVSGNVVTAGGLTAPSRVDVVLEAAALTTRDAKRDADLRSDHFFDVARYPQITFDSDRVRTTGPQTFSIDGRLTMHGVTRPITFDAHATNVRGDARGKRRVHYDAVGSFRRSDYGMTYARGVVGNVVKLNVTIEAVE